MAAKIYDEVQVRINLFCPPNMVEAAKRHAKAQGISMSQLMRNALASHLSLRALIEEIDHASSNHQTDGA